MSNRTRTLLLVGLGIGLACYGWFDVRRRARVDRGARFHRTDFTVYQVAASALKAGDDPYQARNPRGYRYVYPPFFATLLIPVADWDPPNAALLFFALSMALLLLALSTLRELPGRDGVPLGWKAVLLGVFLCTGFLHQSFQRGQVTVLLLAVQVLAMAAVVRRRWFLASLLLTLGGAVRLTPLLSVGAVGLVLLIRGPRGGWGRFASWSGGAVAGLALSFAIVPWAVLGPPGPRPQRSSGGARRRISTAAAPATRTCFVSTRSTSTASRTRRRAACSAPGPGGPRVPRSTRSARTSLMQRGSWPTVRPGWWRWPRAAWRCGSRGGPIAAEIQPVGRGRLRGSASCPC